MAHIELTTMIKLVLVYLQANSVCIHFLFVKNIPMLFPVTRTNKY